MLRLWLKKADAGGRELVLRHLESQQHLHEWSSDNLLAIDVAAGGPDAELTALVDSLSSLGVDVEWGG